jgi:DDE superfamily endonuclease/Homeodomain-like domain
MEGYLAQGWGSMAQTTARAALILSAAQEQSLRALAASRTAAVREAQRAKILLGYHAGENFSALSRTLHVSRRIVYKHVDRALAAGVEVALRDRPHGSTPTITPEAKAWVLALACTKPKEHGQAAELWTLSALAKHLRHTAKAAGHPSAACVVKSTVHAILRDAPVRPHKIKYYLERRDPEFERKMKEVLIVYREVAELEQHPGPVGAPRVMTVSVDEKPGVQALATTSPDLPPVPGEHPEISRDYEYKRMGTASILAGLDLQDGHVSARVERRHRSVEFVALLRDLDAYYPPEDTIRLLLDNHSAHISKETMAYLATRPNRFIYVHTPKHGSWLNLVETLFGKMARTFLRGIRVKSWQELKARILQGIAEINAAPVVHRWSNFTALDQKA